MKENNYWDKRGIKSIPYKNEEFYTTTALPYYLARRKILLENATNRIYKHAPKYICDFGCGDGWYLAHFSKTFSDKHFFGLDISQCMIDKARIKCPDAQIARSEVGIQFAQKFDLIYSFAVFAHILNDNDVFKYLSNIHNSLKSSGSFLLFEQTGPKEETGRFHIRRNIRKYVELAEKAGFQLEKKTTISFSIHNFFEVKLAPIYLRLFVSGLTYSERLRNANKLKIYRMLSKLCVMLSGNPIKQNAVYKRGNTLFEFRKKNDY